MALPSLDKTWQFNVNRVIASTGNPLNDHKAVLLALKNTFKTFASNPWTVVLSSNAVVANSSDNWSTTSDLTYGNPGTPHSWIVLKQTGISSNFQICIDLPNSSFGNNCYVLVSQSAGFVGGSITNRPTAADSMTVINNGDWFTGDINTFDSVTHVMQSTDGQCTRILAKTHSVGGFHYSGFWIIDKVKNPVTGWTVPFIISQSDSYPTYALLNDITTWTFGYQSGAIKFYMTSEFYGAQALGERILVANDIDGCWPMTPIGLLSQTAGKRGRHGMLYDLWWGSSGLSNAVTYPSGASRQFLHFGNLIFPWNGAVVLV